MRPDSRRWQESTPSEHSHERAGLSAVRDLLPDAEPYRAWSNFTFTTADGRLYELAWPLGIKTTDTRMCRRPPGRRNPASCGRNPERLPATLVASCARQKISSSGCPRTRH